MESRVKVFGHPLHQVLVVPPLGLLATSVVFDLVHLLGDSASAATVASALIAAGLVSGVLAAPWGYMDWLAIPHGTRAKSIGALHGGGNVLVLLLFTGSWWLRVDEPALAPVLAHVLSFGAAGLPLITAWLGGELVDRLGGGVSPNTPLNAHSPLAGPAEPPPETPHGPHPRMR